MAAVLLKTDADGALDDNGTNYQGFVKSRALLPQSLGGYSELTQRQQPILAAKTQAGVTVTLMLDRDFGLETQQSTLLLTAEASELGVLRKFEGAAMGEITVLQVTLGDGAAAASGWSFDAFTVPVLEGGDR